MDADTCYLLASRLSTTWQSRDAEIVFRQALELACHLPTTITWENQRCYKDSVEMVVGSKDSYVQFQGAVGATGRNLLERLRGSVKPRAKLVQRLQNSGMARLIVDGWALHYNNFKAHESLNGQTPADAAKAKSPFTNWESVAARGPGWDPQSMECS